MRKLGLIGGVGPESSIEYYRLIINRFQDKTRSNDYPELIIHSINMTKMLSFVNGNQLDELVDFLLERVKVLELSGADFGAMASNTPHIIFKKLAKKANIPLISIVEETCKYIKNQKLKRVGLFGTKSTMTAGFYNEVGNKYGIEFILPNGEDQDFIHAKYMSELVFNRIIPETKKRLIEIAKELKRNGFIQGLVLGGTELPLILKQADFNEIDIFDTTQIHVESIVSKMMENESKY